MHNFQFLDSEQAKATFVCCGMFSVSLREWGGGELNKKFSDLVLFAFEQCCSSVLTPLSFSLSPFEGA